MSGSNTICVATVLLETGMVEVHEPITRLNLESPAGIIPVECQVSDGKVTSVRFTNQPAFVYELNAKVEVAGLGTFGVDVAWGGMTYFIIGAKELGFEIVPDEARDICAVMEQIKTAAAQQIPVTHPIHPEFPGISVGVLAGSVENIAGVKTSKNTVVVSPGRLDRSPCGTGTSARMAVMHARGELEVGERFVHTSIIDSTFDCRIESTTTVGGKDAIVPSIAGQAWITEFSTMVLDPSDPYPAGYRLTDTWPKGLDFGL
jgi:proline racemase